MYWLVFFSVVVHGLSVPILVFFYRYTGVKPIEEDTIEILPFSQNSPFPRQSKSFESTEKVVVLDERKEKHVSWESKTSFDDDKQSLDLSDVKKEVKDMV